MSADYLQHGRRHGPNGSDPIPGVQGEPTYAVGATLNAGAGFEKNVYRAYAGNGNTGLFVNDSFETTWLFNNGGLIELSISNNGVRDFVVETTHWYIVNIGTAAQETTGTVDLACAAGSSINLSAGTHLAGSSLLDLSTPTIPKVITGGVYNINLLLGIIPT